MGRPHAGEGGLGAVEEGGGASEYVQVNAKVVLYTNWLCFTLKLAEVPHIFAVESDGA